MLGKLIKHDLIATWKVTVAIDSLLIILGILTAVVIQTIPHLEDSFGMSIFMFSFVGLFYIGIIAANIVTIIYLVIRYYKNLYTSEGYLTFTLPVKTDLIIHSKVITGALWMFLCYLCTFIAIAIAGLGFISTVDASWNDIGTALREIYTVMGFDAPRAFVAILLTVLVTPFATVLCMYFSVSVGQLWQSHKILGAVLCVIALYIINQIVSQVAFFGSGFFQMMTMSGSDIDTAFGRIYMNMLLILTVITAIQSAIYYVVCIFISRTKLNLD